MKYKAYLVEESDGVFKGSVKELDKPEIEEGKVIIKVHYSSLNYKDALAATGVKGVVRSYPFVPGIDVAGEILESTDNNFSKGDLVVATGYKIGMAEFGGFGEIVHLNSNWVVKLPDGLSLNEAMNIGTAGITAAASVKKIIDSGISKQLPVLVSGASGGVGSVAVNLLSNLGYEVHAITGKPEQDKILKNMGATQIIDRKEFMADPVKALDKAAYGGGVDTVGGDILSKMLSMIANEGAVSCCGNVAGMKFTSSVFPFILRGVSLIGIDSAESPLEFKKELWNLLANDWLLNLEKYSKVISLEDIDKEIDKILNGQQIGRVVIKHGV
tara:strand:+ start:4478 stop:5461 length:984 start_codon:yes stop_codon:yes gene_type:complete